MSLFRWFKKPKEEPKKYIRYEKEVYGVPSEVAMPIIDESFTADDIRSSRYSDKELKEYCKKLLEAAQITEDRYKSIVGEKPNHLPVVVDKDNE